MDARLSRRAGPEAAAPLVAALLAATLWTTPVAAGDSMPGHAGHRVDDLPLTGWLDLPEGVEIESTSELLGQAVLLYEVSDAEQGTPAAAANGRRVRRANELALSHGRRGLLVIAVIDQNAGNHRRVAQAFDVRTASCHYEETTRDRSRKVLLDQLGHTFPDGVLIDPLGFLCDVDGVTPRDVDRFAGDAFDTLPAAWDDEAAGVGRSLVGRRFGPALKEAARLSESHPDLQAQVEALLAGAVETTRSLYLEGDPHTAWSRLGRLRKELKGTPAAAPVDELFQFVSSDSGFGVDRRDHESLRKLVSKTPPRPKKAARILDDLQAWVDARRGTRFGEEARMWLRYYSDVAAED